jgi:1-acyl-sn-glycerol-3-phosphate acyltransferase
MDGVKPSIIFMYPNYIYPKGLILKVIASILFNRHRSFRLDACEMIAHQHSAPQILGQEYIPEDGPCVITFNHYHRDGFQAWWLALNIAAVVPKEMHWVVTGELTFPGAWYGFIGRPFSRWVLRRLAKCYGFTSMPPMPPRPKDAEARAASVRQVLTYIKRTKDAMLGLAPEGGDNPGGSLDMPATGAGRFGLLLAGNGLHFVPAGAYEAAGTFCLRFGPEYELNLPDGLSAQEKDQQASRIIMQNIANLLPEKLRGDFNQP